MSLRTVLAALPGASADAGDGPAEAALLDGLLDDAAPGTVDPAAALAAHREHLAGPARDLVGALVVPAEAAAPVRDALVGRDHGLRVLLAADGPHRADPLERLRAARADLLDIDGLDVVGVRVPLPAERDDPAGAAAALLAALDTAAPAWIVVPAPAQGPEVLAVLGADGAEHVAVDAAAPGTARWLRALVDSDTSFRVHGAAGAVTARDGAPPGVLNVLCAVRAALNGAEATDLAAVLAVTESAPLAAAARRMSAADAAVVRSFLTGVAVDDVAAVVTEADRLGLLPDA